MSRAVIVSSLSTLSIIAPVAAQNWTLDVFNIAGQPRLQWPVPLQLNNTPGSEFVIGTSTIVTPGQGLIGLDKQGVDLLTTPISNPDIFASPAVGNVIGDRAPEIVALASNRVLLYSRDGQFLNSWSIQIPNFGFITVDSLGVAVLEDLDDDGLDEIIVPIRQNQGTNIAPILVFRGNGQLFPGWPTLTNNNAVTLQVSKPIIVANIAGDCQPEIIVQRSGPSALEAYSANGELLWSSNVLMRQWFAAQMDADPYFELIGVSHGSKMLNEQGLLAHYVRVAELDNDGELASEILIEIDLFYIDDAIFYSNAGALDPIVGDLNRDGRAELVFTTFYGISLTVESGTLPEEHVDLYVLEPGVGIWPGFPVRLPDDMSLTTTPQLLVDVNGDNETDILLDGRIDPHYAFDAYTSTGDQITGFPLNTSIPISLESTTSPMAATDLDGNGSLELIKGLTNGTLVIVDTQSPQPLSAGQYSQFRVNSQHTGRFELPSARHACAEYMIDGMAPPIN